MFKIIDDSKITVRRETDGFRNAFDILYRKKLIAVVYETYDYWATDPIRRNVHWGVSFHFPVSRKAVHTKVAQYTKEQIVDFVKQELDKSLYYMTR